MANKTICAKEYSKMLIGAAQMLLKHIDEINDLNVFPVPDGDTGTNMAKTIEGGLSAISDDSASDMGKLSKSFAHGVLLGARGNSGVILSQIFAGICEELGRHEKIDAGVLASAYKRGIEKSYRAVQNPTEGTLLTVFREATEYASENINESSSIEDFFELHIEKAKESLAKTKEILPALAEADVVDSGGAGYLYIAIGMYNALTGKLTSTDLKMPSQAQPSVNIDLFTRDSKLEFGYCTEFLLRLTSAKCDPDAFEASVLISSLEALGGESIVAYKTEDVVKVHVHTFEPGMVLASAQRFGEFLTVKIENMSLGHSESTKPQKGPSKKFSVLAVATGEGMCALFKETGADNIVSGGQSANPSAEEFISAFDKCNSENIIVLPNNKNVFLAAKQASELYDKAKVHIIPTKSLMQGYAGLSVVTPGITDIDTLVKSITRASQSIVDAEVTMAVRDVTIDGKAIKTGDYIAISEGEIVAVADSSENAVKQMLEGVDMDDYEIITLFVGKDVTEQRRATLTEELEELYPDCEITVYEGGQDVYDYMIAVE